MPFNRFNELSLGEAGTVIGGTAHLGEHSIEPLKRTVEMGFDPARGGGDCLPPVLGSPSLDELNNIHSYNLYINIQNIKQVNLRS
jgi:hypothetical protein